MGEPANWYEVTITTDADPETLVDELQKLAVGNRWEIQDISFLRVEEPRT